MILALWSSWSPNSPMTIGGREMALQFVDANWFPHSRILNMQVRKWSIVCLSDCDGSTETYIGVATWMKYRFRSVPESVTAQPAIGTTSNCLIHSSDYFLITWWPGYARYIFDKPILCFKDWSVELTLISTTSLSMSPFFKWSATTLEPQDISKG